MVSSFLKTASLVFLSSVSGLSFAIDPIPTKSGFSGYINLGVSSIKGETNLIAGNSVGDIGNRTISSIYDQPNSQRDTIPIVNGELTYTFAASRTQIYYGNQLEDFIQFDFSTLFGVRHELADKSLVAASYVYTGIPTEEWEDPYISNQRRSKTDRDSQGLRLEWDKIAGTQLGLQYTYRDITIEDELSGQGLGLADNQKDLLDREGTSHNFELRYNFSLGNGQSLKPKLIYIVRDLDGGAMKSDIWSLGLTHIYNSEKYSFITNLDWSDAQYDKRNPIYNKTRNDNRWGGGFTAVYKKPFGLKKWNLLGTAAYYNSDSNIDFYNTNIQFIGASMLYRF